jgi:hypothetical protein
LNWFKSGIICSICEESNKISKSPINRLPRRYDPNIDFLDLIILCDNSLSMKESASFLVIVFYSILLGKCFNTCFDYQGTEMELLAKYS